MLVYVYFRSVPSTWSDPANPSRSRQGISRARSCLRFSTQFSRKLCRECHFSSKMTKKYCGVLWRFVETTNSHKNCAEQRHNSGSWNSAGRSRQSSEREYAPCAGTVWLRSVFASPPSSSGPWSSGGRFRRASTGGARRPGGPGGVLLKQRSPTG